MLPYLKSHLLCFNDCHTGTTLDKIFNLICKNCHKETEPKDFIGHFRIQGIAVEQLSSLNNVWLLNIIQKTFIRYLFLSTTLLGVEQIEMKVNLCLRKHSGRKLPPEVCGGWEVPKELQEGFLEKGDPWLSKQLNAYEIKLGQGA